jgi:predicted DNA-binding protein (MmcQ/YjbR family)
VNADSVIRRFRDLCLGFPESSEADSWGHPNFRAGKRTFATIEWIKGRPSFAFRVGAEETNVLLLRSEQVFSTPYGKGKWVSLWADVPPNWDFVQELTERSYRSVALKRMIVALERAKAQGACE